MSMRRNDHNALVGRRIIKRTIAAAAAGLILALTVCGRGGGEYRLLVRYAEAETSPAPAPAQTEEAPDLAEFTVASSVIPVSIDGRLVEMELEDYIVGVVAGEMSASSEPAALEAQAVAARTFTVLHMTGGAKCAHGAEGCTVCSDPSCCQAYAGPERLREAWGASYDRYFEKISAAVENTRGMIAVYGGRPISALYHASSGPATENSEAVFAMALPYLVSVDSFEGEKEAVSVQTFSAAELIDRLNAAHPDARLRLPLKDGDIDVWGRTESGRVQLVQIGSTVITGAELRKLLGLKSTDFTVEINKNEVSFTCIGYGHGVGMSQLGANEMAKEGYSYEEILLHFYTGTELAKLAYDAG